MEVNALGSAGREQVESPFESKADYITRALRRQIRDRTLSPGAVLRQRALAETFGVSPTPVREALSRLQAEGYIVTRLHQGASVVRSVVERRQENWRIRAALESLAAELAAERMTPNDLDEISCLAESFDRASTPEEAHRANFNFHFRIYAATKAPVLVRFLEELWRSLDVAPDSYRLHKDSSSQHFEIVEALRTGTPPGAGELLRQHILQTADAAVSLSSVPQDQSQMTPEDGKPIDHSSEHRSDA